MRAPLIPLLLLLIVNAAVDYFIYRRASKCHSDIWKKVQLSSALLGVLILLTAIFLPARSGSETMLKAKMWTLFSYLTLYIPKYLGLLFDLIASLPILWRHSRCHALTKTGIAFAIVAFVAMWWGALVNRFNIDVQEITVEIPGLPPSFDGMTIAQFSDLHTGTFGSDTTFVNRLVDRINNLHPDLIVFTGDIVDRQSDEAHPFIASLSRLNAPMGFRAILGNHDYGDYRDWDSPADKADNMTDLYKSFRNMGADLILNETRWLHAGGDSIALIGVENIGDPPFKIYGSLPKAYPSLSDSNTKILLTHNPQHWVDSIAGNRDANIALTLSGHTHAMQMQVGRISPAAFRYPIWGGIYYDSDNHTFARKLYVNIGSGTVGLPMRLGATPEITLLTLKAVPAR